MMKYKGKKLNVIRMGHPTLVSPTKLVEEPSSEEIKYIIQDLIFTANKLNNAVGLAATQVNIPLSIFIYRKSLNEEFIPIINPKIEVINNEDKLHFDYEACFSIPGMAGNTPRVNLIKLFYQDPTGKHVIKELSGFAARVVQHETDHLNSKLYIHRIAENGNISEFGFDKEISCVLNSVKN